MVEPCRTIFLMASAWRCLWLRLRCSMFLIVLYCTYWNWPQNLCRLDLGRSGCDAAEAAWSTGTWGDWSKRIRQQWHWTVDDKQSGMGCPKIGYTPDSHFDILNEIISVINHQIWGKHGYAILIFQTSQNCCSSVSECSYALFCFWDSMG